ncbi:MAG: translocation/assembly module TamB, partial [Cyclobacteriaceae bacterium]|nr:translocation/assembly module TamB [Cyclobacteriaceae bacterium]
MNLQVIKNRVLYWLKFITLYSLYTIVFLLLSSFFLLQLPAVQSIAANRLLKQVSAATDFNSTIGRVEFYWFDRLVLTNVRIEDPEKNLMIGVERLMVNFSFSGLFQSQGINLDGAVLNGAAVNLITIQENDSLRDLNINIFIARLSGPETTASTGSTPIAIGEALLKNSHFMLHTNGDTLAGIFNPGHFAVTIDDAELNQFLILGDTIEFRLLNLTAQEDFLQFPIHQLSTFFRISQSGMEFTGLNLKAGESIVSDTIHFHYRSQEAMIEFIDSVLIEAHLFNTILHPQDLRLFFPIPEELNKPIALSGDFNGRISRFRFTNMDLQLGGTHLKGVLEMDGLPDIMETFILLSLRESQIDFNDLSFIFDDAALVRLEPFGKINFRGQFLGYPNDFVATGNINSQIGRITSDINLKIGESSVDFTRYRGSITLSNFDLGTFLNDTARFQKVNMNGSIEGKGITLETADFTLKGYISSIGLLGYVYENISTNARFASEYFNGELTVHDPNLMISANGSVDLRNKLNRIEIHGRIDTAYLHNLKLVSDYTFLQTDMDIDMYGLELDSLKGNALLKNLTVGYRDESITVSEISLEAIRESHQRSLALRTTYADLDTRGDFYFSDLFRDIPQLVKEFRLNIENDPISLTEYYLQKTGAPPRYAADFTVVAKNIRPIMELFDIDVAISRNTTLAGRFSNGLTSNLQAFTRIDSIRFGNSYFYRNELEVNASKYYDSTTALAMVYVSSANQEFGKIKTNNLMGELIWDKTHIDVDASIAQPETTNRFDLSATIELLDSTLIKLNPSNIRVLDEVWGVNRNNSIVIRGKEWKFTNIGFNQGEQIINVNGYLSQDSTRELQLEVHRFNLANINPLITQKLKGTLEAEIAVNNIYSSLNFQNLIFLNGLEINDFLIGDITGKNTWEADDARFSIAFLVERLGTRIVDCSGYYNPGIQTDPLNILAQFNRANLKIIEPFLDEIFSDFQGTLSGLYTIRGSLTDPVIEGEGKLENGGMKINYLSTYYQFTGILGLAPQSIYFKDIELTDAFRNRARLNGEIRHNAFANMRISLDGQLNDFQVLNTTAKDNSLFYGQAFASGTVRFSGPLDNLVISATATTRKNTRVYIPISGVASTEQKDYIRFVNFRDSTYILSQQLAEERKVKLTGLTLDFNLDVTPDAYCEIIFDLKAGDIIRGRGNGKIKLQLDTQGEFNMFGPIEFTEGWYNFTLYDIINKEFQIQPGSTLTWYGDPYQGNLKINASYNQLTSLAPILSDQSLASEPQMRRKYPIQVLLKLEGLMLSPSINFDIVGKDLPKSVVIEGRPPVALDLEFTAFKSRLDEQELKRQVFSIIVLRRFSPPESFNTSGSLAGSVSELFSNQLSYWLSQVDENLEIDVDLGSMDQESFNTFQLRMSYTFLNGRLRVTRDGTMGNQSQSTPGSELAAAIGDWTVDYILTPDGKFKVKMYSRANVNPTLNATNTQGAMTTGVSLMHTQ